MALTRKLLKGLGIDGDNLETIIEAHTDSVEAVKTNMQTKIDDLTNELNDLKAKGDNGLQQKYDEQVTKYNTLKQEFDDYKADVANKETLAKKKSAYEAIAKDSGLSEKGIEKALKYADYESIELDDDGKIKDAKNHIKSLKEEWSEYVVKEEVKGANTPTPPNNVGGRKYNSREEIAKIQDMGERRKVMAQNLDLYGID